MSIYTAIIMACMMLTKSMENLNDRLTYQSCLKEVRACMDVKRKKVALLELPSPEESAMDCLQEWRR